MSAPGSTVTMDHYHAILDARDKREKEAVLAEREACAKIADTAMLVPPDGGSPTEDEIAMCERIASFIRARSDKPVTIE